MTSRQDTSTTTGTGAHRKHRAPAGRNRDREREPERVRDRARRSAPRPQGTLPMQPPAHYEPYLDGLFTYCLSVLREHDAAAAALGELLALAERQRARLRDPARRRCWLYALARWVCLRRLAAGAAAAPVPRAAEAVAESRRAELAALAWPEAAGTTPEQREALELAVRHQLPAADVARVLGLEADPARALLARAACEVERTRTALAVVDTGRCAAVARHAGETTALLGTALRAELVRHVDDCEVCRRTAERVVAGGPWPGAAPPGDPAAGDSATAVLVLVEAPRSAAYAALLAAMGAGVGRARDATPRFDRHGFPLDLKDRAARRARLRHRVVTSTVVAAVVAAPVLALWAAYRAAPLGDEAPGTDRRTAASGPDGLDGVSYERAGGTQPSARRPAAAPGTPGLPSTTVAVSAAPKPTATEHGYLTVTARAARRGTAVTLTAGPGGPVRWTASTAAYWLRLSATSGVLRPAESITLMITVDRALQPDGSWTADITFAPAGATVTLRGTSTRSVPPPPPTSPPPDPTPPTPPPPSPSPTDTPSATPTDPPTATDPGTPTPTDT